MNVLVTGGNGFIGYHLWKRLIVDGHSVHVIDNLSVGTKDNEVPGVSYSYKDINEPVNLYRSKNNIDCIFHLAALSRIQPSFKNPSDTFKPNVCATEMVFE